MEGNQANAAALLCHDADPQAITPDGTTALQLAGWSNIVTPLTSSH
ncbi:hypothetical protein [Pseudomonas sp. M47T1]|nr:hypothetical protein [Pseudomonas sp. M47T1]